MPWPPILVRYGEIGIKSRTVRSQFEKRLVERIEEQLVRRGAESEVLREEGRIVVRAAEQEKALDALKHTFGIVSASPARQCASDIDVIADEVAMVARELVPKGASFALKVKRVGEHKFTSLDVAKRAAGRVFDALPDHALTVNLNEPDVALHVEVRDNESFVFTRTIRGPGGLPLGSQGRVGVWVDGPRAAHAAWLIGKRGASLYFFAPDIAKAEAWLAPLAPWIPQFRVRQSPSVKDASGLLDMLRCQALIRADGLEAQWESRDADADAGVPVFRPLTGYPGARFRELARLAELPEEV